MPVGREAVLGGDASVDQPCMLLETGLVIGASVAGGLTLAFGIPAAILFLAQRSGVRRAPVLQPTGAGVTLVGNF